jgi:hypothetical protein
MMGLSLTLRDVPTSGVDLSSLQPSALRGKRTAQIKAFKEKEFVRAAQALGASPGYIIRRHLIPNAISPIIVGFVLAIPLAMMLEASLSFLGVGIPPPTLASNPTESPRTLARLNICCPLSARSALLAVTTCFPDRKAPWMISSAG